MAPDWSDWRDFPDPRSFGILVAPFGPGVYEMRNEGASSIAAAVATSHCE